MDKALPRLAKRPERSKEPLGKTIATVLSKSGLLTPEAIERRRELDARRAAQGLAILSARLRAESGVRPREAAASLWAVDRPARMLTEDDFAAYLAVRDDVATLLDFGGTLVLSGRNGPGKTWLACGLVNEFCDRGRPAFYCTAQGYYRELQKRFGKPELMDAWYAKLSGKARGDDERERGFELLVVDEVEVQPQNDWHLNELRDLINERYDRLVATVLVTNLSREEINGKAETAAAKCFNTAIRDRIKQIGSILECHWPSLREPEWAKATAPKEVAKP
jgi:DNA replication protein DnaC